jgi:hypothetical protein
MNVYIISEETYFKCKNEKMTNGLLSLDELLNFMCWMLMKIEKNITEREKDKEITPAVDWKNSSRSRPCSENFQTHRHKCDTVNPIS